MDKADSNSTEGGARHSVKKRLRPVTEFSLGILTFFALVISRPSMILNILERWFELPNIAFFGLFVPISLISVGIIALVSEKGIPLSKTIQIESRPARLFTGVLLLLLGGYAASGLPNLLALLAK